MNKIIVCPDSFKGSLYASEVASIISDTLRKKIPNAEIIELPLSDGGEGTGEILTNKLFPKTFSISSFDASLRPLVTHYFTSIDEKSSFIDSALIIGLPLILHKDRNPMTTSSYGLGIVMKHLIEKQQIMDITISLGGSAVCDGGIGMLRALGFKFYNISGKEIKGIGQDLISLYKLEFPKNWDIIRKVNFHIIHDVENPLLGKYGAVNIYAPQKGAKPSDLPVLERGMENYVEVCKKFGINNNLATKQGAGAAGGLGYALMAFLNADSVKGIDFILDSYNFDNYLKNCSQIITGEGKIDNQSLMGKVISGVLKRALNYNIPVIAIAGQVENRDDILQAGIHKLIEISDKNFPIEINMEKEKTRQNIINAIDRNFPFI